MGRTARRAIKHESNWLLQVAGIRLPHSSSLRWRPFSPGDCEDYAVVKYLALMEVGMSEADLRIVLMKSVFPNEDHAALAARVAGEWLILDSRILTLDRHTDVMRAAPIFVLDNLRAWRVRPSRRARRDGPLTHSCNDPGRRSQPSTEWPPSRA
ncbi:transglutaminase-like cysteine peptidase [Bradyrhizobium sp. USDA 3364]